MKADNAVELFQTMAIVSLNMENLILEVNTLKIDWLQRRRRRQCYMRNWIKREISKKDISIMWKYGRRTGQRLSKKNIIKNLQDENEEFKGSTTQLKLYNEKLQNLR
jgi:hypothetical protein